MAALSRTKQHGAIAQLGERVLCKHEVVGSIPSASTIFHALSIIFVLRLLVLTDCGGRGQLLERWIAAPLWGERMD